MTANGYYTKTTKVTKITKSFVVFVIFVTFVMRPWPVLGGPR